MAVGTLQRFDVPLPRGESAASGDQTRLFSAARNLTDPLPELLQALTRSG